MSYNPQPPPTDESSFHKANCHCGAVRFTVRLSPPLKEYPVKSCNCSICSRNGYLLVYPNLEDFTLLKGEEKLKEHKFNSRLAGHQFCGDCGSSCFAKIDEKLNAKFLSVNVSCYLCGRVLCTY